MGTATIVEQRNAAMETVLALGTQVVRVAVFGLRGMQGPPGNAEDIQCVAGEELSALRAVYELNGAVYLLDWRDASHIDLLLGVTVTSADAGGHVSVKRTGFLVDAAWAWTPGRVYLGANGSLTQTPPADGFDVLIGVAVSATRLLLDLQDPIELE